MDIRYLIQKSQDGEQLKWKRPKRAGEKR